MTSRLTGAEAWSLLALSAACVGIIINTFHGNGEPLIASLAFSGIAFAFAFSLIRWLGETFMRTNLKGRDMSKLKKPEMYEDLSTIYSPMTAANVIIQSRDYGSYLCCCLSSCNHCFHTISFLQRHCRSYIKRGQQRNCGGT